MRVQSAQQMRGGYSAYRQQAAMPAAGAPAPPGYRQSVGAAVDSMRNMHVGGGAPHAGGGHL